MGVDRGAASCRTNNFNRLLFFTRCWKNFETYLHFLHDANLILTRQSDNDYIYHCLLISDPCYNIGAYMMTVVYI